MDERNNERGREVKSGCMHRRGSSRKRESVKWGGDENLREKESFPLTF
jgi:hypothetical protein